VHPKPFPRENGCFRDGTISHMSDREPLPIRQVLQATEDIAQLAHRAECIAKLLADAYGSEDRRTVRAQEVRDAIQRLQWAMERSKAMTA
jgi:hypothetical protein